MLSQEHEADRVASVAWADDSYLVHVLGSIGKGLVTVTGKRDFYSNCFCLFSIGSLFSVLYGCI